tara:strand:- start:2378 stop:3085 length:708 start_codon:yes stop_codon:yes gene_type:complete
MPDISQELDKIAEEFAGKVDLAKDSVVQVLMDVTEGKTAEESLKILSGINIEKSLEFKLIVAFTAFEVGIKEILKNTYTTAIISESALQLLLNNAKGMISDEVTKHLSKTMLQSIVDGIGSGQTSAQVISSLNEKIPNIETLINTTYSQFSNTITNMTAELLPENTKFIYIGAYDEKTRDRCVQKIQSGSLTRKEILGRFGDMNNELFNCRHKWEQMSDSPEDQGYNPEEFKSNA